MHLGGADFNLWKLGGKRNYIVYHEVHKEKKKILQEGD